MSDQLQALHNFTSIRSLSFLALAILGLPLLLSLSIAIYQVQQLAERGQSSMVSLASSVSNAEALEHQVKELERLAKQALILQQDAAFERYHQQFLRLRTFVGQNITPATNIINDLEALDLAIYHEQLDSPSVDGIFERLYLQSALIHRQSRLHIEQQAKVFSEFIESAKQSILMSIAMLPVTVLVAVLMLWGITKPLKQLYGYIQRWHSDKLLEPICVQGVEEVAVIADALEQMRQRTDFLETQRRQFLRHLSHELKTPLAAIREGNSLLYDNALGELNPQQQEICEILKQSSLRLQLLIENLLDFNLVLAEQPQRSTLDIQALSQRVLSQHQLSIKSRQLQLGFSFDIERVVSNPEQLRVILDNLISNAIKFAPSESQILIGTLRLPDNRRGWFVEDQGEGVSEDCDIFEPFVQGSQSANSSIKGSGLGLTIAKELAELLDLELDYQRHQQRTRFVVSGFEVGSNEK